MTTETQITSGLNEVQKKSYANLVRRSMGDMTISEFSARSGLSVSFLSKSLNSALQTKPSQRSLAKLAKATPEGGPSIKDYYEVCGFDSTILAGRQPEIKKMPLQEAIWTYYSSPSVMGINNFLMAWMGHDNGSDLDLRLFQGGNIFTIRKREDAFSGIVITAYCQDAAAIELLKSKVLAQMLEALGVADRENLPSATYYFLTDQIELFQFCSNDLPKLPSQDVVVLLADQKHSGFCKETLRLADGSTGKQLPQLSYV